MKIVEENDGARSTSVSTDADRHRSQTQSMMLMVVRRGEAVVAAEPVVKGDLVDVEQCAGL